MKRLALLAALAAMFLAGLAATAAPPVKDAHSIDLGDSDSVIELKDTLGPYQMPASAKTGSDASTWYTFIAVNNSTRPAIRVLLAGQEASGALRFMPRRTRPRIESLASSDPSVIVESAKAYGAHAYRVTIPPATSAPIAVELGNAEAPPSLLAWTEPALAAHNRQLGIFIAAVAGLIFAAAAISGGLAVMSGHRPPLWAALTLLLVLLTRLAGTGMFDKSLATHVGGPYGLTAFFSGLALIAGARLAITVVPMEGWWVRWTRWFDWSVIAIVGLSVLAYLGVPVATDLTYAIVIVGAAVITAYLVHRGRFGVQAARVLAPSAAVFALVALAAALSAMGFLGDTSVAPDIAGGFAAAGAVLLALAVVAGEGIAVLPALRMSGPDAIHPTALKAIGAAHQGIFDLEFGSDEVLLSREAAALLGLSETKGTMPHRAWIARVHPDDRSVYEQAVTGYRAQAGLAFRIEFRVRNETGNYPWFELRATMLGPDDRANRCLGLIADITMRKESEVAVADRSLTDPLTGLGNRAALMIAFEAMGDGFMDASVAVLDIDRFKAIHSSLGDTSADALLAGIGGRLKNRFGSEAEIFRIGGDSFALLFRHPTGAAATIGAEVAEACAGAYVQDGRSVFAPASIGISVGHDARDAQDLVKNAELALMQAKHDGGGCARVYARAMSSLAQGDSVALEAELRNAIEHDQLEMFYQPIVRVADSSVAGFEALIRWRHPEKGLISPDDFIAHCEETGLIVTLGRFALEQAAHDLSQWQRFFPLNPPLFASVNVSRRQLRDPALEPFLRQLLADCGIVPGTLKLEVTESAVAANAQAILRRIRALGAGLAIDDFGTGQSSLSQLKDIPFDTVKIDKSFLARHGGTHSESDSGVVLSSIVTLAHDLKRDVVLEGVENEDDVAWLKQIGCEFAQGFYYAPPLPLADALNYIARHYNPGSAIKITPSGAAGLGGQA
jgi:diguanylate cyclase (GGDEF)-like protein/PAS domain S-box-containing protein